MGKQSSRIYYKGRDHKDVYYNHHYHSAMYICEETEDGEVECKLVWRKIFDENLYICDTIYNPSASITREGFITVDMDKKEVYYNTHPECVTSENGKQRALMKEPNWANKKMCASILLNRLGYNSSLYISRELVFNNYFELNFSNASTNTVIQKSQYPNCIWFANAINQLVIKKLIIEKNEVTVDTRTVYLQGVERSKAILFTGYNSSKYIYILVEKNGKLFLAQFDIDGTLKELELENFTPSLSFTRILAAKDEKVYLLSTKVNKYKTEDTEIIFVVNSITIVDGMKILSTEVIDSWDSGQEDFSTEPKSLAASFTSTTVSPISLIYRREFTSVLHGSLITIKENTLISNEIALDNFSFFVNLYEDGEIVDTITVSAKYGCTDMKNGIFWLLDLARDLSGGGAYGKSVSYEQILHYTENGWVEGGTHGAFYDKETQYCYTFYIEKLYPSSKNFFIRFRI